jgi:hypothetical protein
MKTLLLALFAVLTLVGCSSDPHANIRFWADPANYRIEKSDDGKWAVSQRDRFTRQWRRAQTAWSDKNMPEWIIQRELEFWGGVLERRDAETARTWEVVK